MDARTILYYYRIQREWFRVWLSADKLMFRFRSTESISINFLPFLYFQNEITLKICRSTTGSLTRQYLDFTTFVHSTVYFCPWV